MPLGGHTAVALGDIAANRSPIFAATTYRMPRPRSPARLTRSMPSGLRIVDTTRTRLHCRSDARGLQAAQAPSSTALGYHGPRGDGPHDRDEAADRQPG